MELIKKNDLVWDKAVQIMLTVESLQKNVTTAEKVARTIQKATHGDGGLSELVQIKGRMRSQEDLLLKMEKQMRETQAGLLHITSSNEAIATDLEAIQHKTEASVQKVNRQIAILEDGFNKEKKRHQQELHNLQTALEENEKMETLQESVDLLKVDLANLRGELDGNLDAETPPSLKKLEYRVATMTGQLNRERNEAQRKVKSLTSWIKKIFAGVKKDFEGHAVILR
ncbi:unnamed protein product [Oikopleura dioica]|uniref:Uncharacterized protein n=1 Tax=Oikopleura dioica TaxID=34765 RepID=E4X8A6_OIKDI|nr:unnamed protein product [Oikopleura dioica]